MTWDDSESLSLCLFRQMNHQCSADLGYAMNTFIGCAMRRCDNETHNKVKPVSAKCEVRFLRLKQNTCCIALA